MSNTKQAIVYLLHQHPKKENLYLEQLAKILYLIDWKHTLEAARPYTDLQWVYESSGPWSDELDKIAQDDDLEVIRNAYRRNYDIIRLRHPGELSVSLGETAINVIGHIIRETVNLNIDEFNKLVYSTYPMVTTQRSHTINLLKAAREYKTKDFLLHN